MINIVIDIYGFIYSYIVYNTSTGININIIEKSTLLSVVLYIPSFINFCFSFSISSYISVIISADDNLNSLFKSI